MHITWLTLLVKRGVPPDLTGKILGKKAGDIFFYLSFIVYTKLYSKNPEELESLELFPRDVLIKKRGTINVGWNKFW